MYRVKSRLETGKKLEKTDYEELLAVCQKENPNIVEENLLIPGYVGAMLSQDGQKIKVYKKNSQFQNDSVTGFMIYKFSIKNEGNCKIKDTKHKVNPYSPS